MVITVTAIYRYPVKGLSAEKMNRVALFAHQHDEMGLRRPFRALRIEAGRAERNREAPIVRQTFAGHKNLHSCRPASTQKTAS